MKVNVLSRLNLEKKITLSSKDDPGYEMRLFESMKKKQKDLEKSRKSNLEKGAKKVDEVLKKVLEFQKTKNATNSQLNELNEKLNDAFTDFSNHLVQIGQFEFCAEELVTWCKERKQSLNQSTDKILKEIRDDISSLRKD